MHSSDALVRAIIDEDGPIDEHVAGDRDAPALQISSRNERDWHGNRHRRVRSVAQLLELTLFARPSKLPVTQRDPGDHHRERRGCTDPLTQLPPCA